MHVSLLLLCPLWCEPMKESAIFSHTQQAHTCRSSGAIPLITTMPLNAIRINAYHNIGIRVVVVVVRIFTVKEEKKDRSHAPICCLRYNSVVLAIFLPLLHFFPISHTFYRLQLWHFSIVLLFSLENHWTFTRISLSVNVFFKLVWLWVIAFQKQIYCRCQIHSERERKKITFDWIVLCFCVTYVGSILPTTRRPISE